MAVDITPFWQRFPELLQYPFRKPALWALLGAMGGSLVVALIPIFGPLALLALTWAVMKYGCEILFERAEGYDEPPEIVADRSGNGLALAFVPFGLFLVIGVVGALIAQGESVVPALTVSALMLIPVPACLVLLGSTSSAQDAVNPVRLARTVRHIGWPYALLYAISAVLALAGPALATAVDLFLPGYFATMVALIVGYYGAFVLFYLVGYAVYQFHVELDFLPEVVLEEGTLQTLDDELAPYEAFLAKEKYGAAKAELLAVIARHPDKVELKQRLHRVAQLTGDNALLIRNGEQLISEYVDARRYFDAANIYQDCVRTDPAFRPKRAEDYAPLLEHLRGQGDGKAAVKLVNGFHKRFPDHPATPSLYVKAAQILSEELERHDQATAILDFVIKQYPRNPDTRQAKALRKSLTGVG